MSGASSFVVLGIGLSLTAGVLSSAAAFERWCCAEEQRLAQPAPVCAAPPDLAPAEPPPGADQRPPLDPRCSPEPPCTNGSSTGASTFCQA